MTEGIKAATQLPDLRCIGVVGANGHYPQHAHGKWPGQPLQHSGDLSPLRPGPRRGQRQHDDRSRVHQQPAN